MDALRRRLLAAGLAMTAATLGPSARPAFAARGGDPLRLGVDRDLFDGGFAPALQKAFIHDTGVTLRLVSAPASDVLSAAEQGEVDMALTNAPAAEESLAARGLVSDRTLIGYGALVLIGPSPLAKALGPRPDVVDALGLLVRAQAPFLGVADGSGGHLAEQALWRLAGVAPRPPWYRVVAPGRPLVTQVREARACAFVERGVWLAARVPAREMTALVETDARLAMPIHVMRSFRAAHPGGKLLLQWLRGPVGQRTLAAQRGYRPAAG